jgi:hypothetical protein
MSTTPVKLPEILEKIADLVLAHKPKQNNAQKKRGKTKSPTSSSPRTKRPTTPQ